MATTSQRRSPPSGRWPSVDFLLAGRPLIPLTVAWLMTAGHTMNLRELGEAQGWVPAESFALQTAFLFALALTLLACPALGQRLLGRHLAGTGLGMLAAGSFLNGWLIYAPLEVFLLGRALAGGGAALVLYFTSRLLDRRWKTPSSWAGILLPAVGPPAIAAASMVHGVSDWQWGFFYEGGAALLGLLVLLSIRQTPQSSPAAPAGSLLYLPSLLLGMVVLGYILHWGQLSGWLEDFKIVAATVIGLASFALTAWLIGPRLDWPALRENWPRLLLYFYGGLNQYFHGYTMNVYGGLLVNFSTWQRSWLIWSMPLGIATSLLLLQILHRRREFALGLLGAAAGLLLLAIGLYLNHRETLDWPFWQLFDPIDLNWFPAPQHWQLAPGRYLMGAGVGLFMSAMDKQISPDPAHEEKVHPFLLVVQTFGGGIGAGLLVNFLLIGHPLQYSYSADRGYIQADELTDRKARLSDDLARAGERAPQRAAEALVYRAINYEADNMVFAFIYDAFLVASLILAGLCVLVWIYLV